jgi:hypothetical protein
MENIKLEYKSTFESPIRFCNLGENHPDNYYMNKCRIILNNLFDKESYKILNRGGGGGGGQGCGYVWNSYEYIEDFIQKEIVITVTHDGNKVDIEIHYDKSNFSQKFIEIMEEKIKGEFLDDQTVYTKIIQTEMEDINDENYTHYRDYINEIFNYFNKPNYQFCNTTNSSELFKCIYVNNYQINNYDIKVKIIVSRFVIYIYIDAYNNNLNKIGFDIIDFENYFKII